MIICSECFLDDEISLIIKSLNNRGMCPTCGKRNSFIYDTETDDQLNNIFDDLISIYSTMDSLPADFPKSDLHLLKDELQANWNIFDKLTSAQIYCILVELSKDMYSEYPNLFDLPVGNPKKYDSQYLSMNSILRTNQWDEFVKALKYDNRFHTDHVNTDILDIFCSYIRKTYHAGAIFYRGRISPDFGYIIDDMGAPPKEVASDGRANSAGISRLYLANNIDTTIREVRAGAFDIISVGKFVLKEDITVVDLKSIDKISPFIESLDCLQYAINKEHLNKINIEMGRSLRRSDSPLDYIPTQYISDFIKSIKHDGVPEYAGIEYKSTMNSEGYNLAIFNPTLFDCIEVSTYKIDELAYKTSVYEETP